MRRGLPERSGASFRAPLREGMTHPGPPATTHAKNLAVQASGLELSVIEGADSITGAQAALAE